MALTIRMRIDEQDEHSYVFSTGDGGQIELIPLSVVQNGVYRPSQENQAFNLVTVEVPEQVVEQLNITANGTYEQAGVVYDVVTVNVEPLLEAVSRSYTENGTYTIAPTEGYDGISDVTVVVDVPQEQPNLESKSVLFSVNDVYNIVPDAGYDGLSDVTVEVAVQGGGNVFSTEFTAVAGANYINLSGGQMPTFIYVLSKDFSAVMNGGGRNIFTQYVLAQDPETSGYYFKEYAYKGSATSTTSQSATTSHTSTMASTPTSNGATALIYDSANDRIGYFGLALSNTGSSTYGFGVGTKYQLFAIY